jgi:hypothetical protein
MNSELQQLAKDYIKQIAASLAIRSKSSPTRTTNGEWNPLVEAMGRLAMCVRNPATTDAEYIKAINEASSWWTSWYDKQTRFEERLADAHKAAFEAGDWMAVLSEFLLTGDTSLLMVKE